MSIEKIEKIEKCCIMKVEYFLEASLCLKMDRMNGSLVINYYEKEIQGKRYESEKPKVP